jgi:hypothetical protein
MRLTTRSLLGIGSVAAIVVSASVGGTALASHGADDATPTSTSTRVQDDKGGLTDRDQRTEPGDDRRVNGSTPTDLPTAGPTKKAKVSKARRSATSRPTSSSTHDAGDDHGHHAAGTDDSGHQSTSTATATRTAAGTDDSGHHTGTDDSGHHSGRDDKGSKGSDDKGGDDNGRHGGHGSDD